LLGELDAFPEEVEEESLRKSLEKVSKYSTIDCNVEG